jgi:integrase
MRWSEVDARSGLWTLPAERVKNGKKHEVPLGRAATDILVRLPRIGETFALTTTGAAPVGGFGLGKCRLDALLPPSMQPWVLHDHSSGSFRGVVGVYQRHDFAEEKRQAAEAWGRHVLTLIR